MQNQSMMEILLLMNVIQIIFFYKINVSKNVIQVNIGYIVQYTMKKKTKLINVNNVKMGIIFRMIYRKNLIVILVQILVNHMKVLIIIQDSQNVEKDIL